MDNPPVQLIAPVRPLAACQDSVLQTLETPETWVLVFNVFYCHACR